MTDDSTTGQITLIAFGPLAERLGGRTHSHPHQPDQTIRSLVEDLGLSEWISFGLSVAVNGTRCVLEQILDEGDEVALLPPVSGG